MGALATYVSARFPANGQGIQQRLVELTNPDNETAIAVNTTLLGLAETDAALEFRLLTGTTFDDTNTTHLAVGYYGVLSKLYDYRGLPRTQAGEVARRAWETICREFTHVDGALAWQSPLTNSTLIPSADDLCQSLPYFDRTVWAPMVPPEPSGGGAFGRDDCGGGCGC